MLFLMFPKIQRLPKRTEILLLPQVIKIGLMSFVADAMKKTRRILAKFISIKEKHRLVSILFTAWKESCLNVQGTL